MLKSTLLTAAICSYCRRKSPLMAPAKPGRFLYVRKVLVRPLTSMTGMGRMSRVEGRVSSAEKQGCLRTPNRAGAGGRPVLSTCQLLFQIMHDLADIGVNFHPVL